MMRHCLLVFIALWSIGVARSEDNATYPETIRKWQAERDEKLRAENGWLTLAGRYLLEEGENTFGVGEDNDIVFPVALQEVGPKRLGSLVVDLNTKKVILKLADGVSITSEGKPISGERIFDTKDGKRDWVQLGRLSMHVIERSGRYILRLADNESSIRKNFPGCIWYPPDAAFKIEAKFVPYPKEQSVTIENVIKEVSKQVSPGYAEFQIRGETYKLDAILDGEGLFFIFRDETAGEGTYPNGRFLDIERRQQDNSLFTLDFNKAYNPPCAFSAFTTCPLPPRQNILKIRIEAGERYRERSGD